MNLQYRIELLSRLGDYMLSDDADWVQAKNRASLENGWFIPDFIEIASNHIARSFLNSELLQSWVASESFSGRSRSVGIVMAGNIPLVGFHDFLCVFIGGHEARIKASSKDNVLIRHLVAKLIEWDESISTRIRFQEMLRHCDAYIATGSNNSSRYFDYYFGKYPHIIRRNRTSVALLSGKETKDDLSKLADDVCLYFGLGCRNVTKLYVPEGYDFLPVLDAFRKYAYLSDHLKYKNNYDYNLAILLLNKQFYMTSGPFLLVESPALFSPISLLNYEFYEDKVTALETIREQPELQAIVGQGFLPYGEAQRPSLNDFADGVNTLRFLSEL